MHNKYRMLMASLATLVGGFFILGITPHRAIQTSWHWPYIHQEIASVETQNSITPIIEIPKQVGRNDVAQVNPTPVDAHAKFVIVLMYHYVGDITSEQRQKDAMLSDLTVSTLDFEAQVKYFHDQGFHSVTVADLYNSFQNGTPLPTKPIIFTFDDGHKDVFLNALPVLQKYGYKGSLAIATELLGRPDYAVWDDVVAADKSGMEILSHTENHLDLTSPVYSADDLHREIVGSKQVLETKLGHPIDFFVYPYGHTNAKVTQLVSDAGYKMAFTTAFGMWMSPKTLLSEPRTRVHGVDGLAKLKKVLTK